MADQAMSEVFMKAVAEATRIVIQTMAEMQTQRTASTPEPMLGGPVLKQPNFILSKVSLLQNKYYFSLNDKLLLPTGQLHQVL